MNAQVMEPIEGTVENPTAMVASTSPASLMLAAVAGGADPATIREMLALQREWEAGEARKAFNEALAAFKGEEIVIRKRKRVHFTAKNSGATTDYKHAELSDCTEAIGPALARHGLAYTWNVEQPAANVVRVTCKLTHRLGHSESITMEAAPDDSGNKNKIQMIGSTATYLQRYTLLAITGCATKGQDNDGRGSAGRNEPPQGVDEPETAEQKAARLAAEEVAKAARRKAQHDEAHGRHAESITFIKERLAASDLKAAVDEWGLIPENDQIALWLATTKGGCLTTEERRQIKEKKL